jgi:hypothetical protein
MKRALTKSQADELLRAASLLPLASRDAFITAVDKQLCRVKRLTDADVSAAITSTLSTLNVTTSHRLMCDAALQQEVPMAPRKGLRFDIRTGREIEGDDDSPLRDGERIFVPLSMRDNASLSPMQRSVMADKAARSPVVDAAGGTAGLHRPGPRYARDQDARAAVEQARAQWIDQMTTAWQRLPTADVRGAQEGDQCTVREGGHDEGAPGHLRRINGELVCVPDRRHQDAAPRGPTYDAAEGERIKAAAYAAMVDELTNAWRTPAAAPPSIEPRANITHVPRTMSLADAQAIRDAAYEQSVRELETAWQRGRSR